jgi:phage terminase large subunit-like protein
MTDAAARALLADLEELARRKRENGLAYYEPYPRQAEFHALGSSKAERLLLGGNQGGKSLAGGAETAMHLTGRYPTWWTGRRFAGPVQAWALGITGESTRDNPQRVLIGPVGVDEMRGSGMVPKTALHDVTLARGVPNAIDSALVRHTTGGFSQLTFKAYERGREKLQGASLDWIWCDEEPEDFGVWTELLARLTARKGAIALTMTPLLGMTALTSRFMQEQSADRGFVRMELGEARHMTAEEVKAREASYPPHERDARIRGVPMLGSGRVFPISEDTIAVDPFALPASWPRIVGLDIGWTHPTAAVWLAWDRDADMVFVTDCHRLAETTPLVHAAAIRDRGAWIPIAWPHDGLQHDKGSGEQIASLYRAQGLRMLPEHATFPDGTNGVEAGLWQMLTRMETGRLRVFRHLRDWCSEFLTLHRKEGRVVKVGDDLISATRYGLMMLRYARTRPAPGGGHSRPQRSAGEYDPFVYAETGAIGAGDTYDPLSG